MHERCACHPCRTGHVPLCLDVSPAMNSKLIYLIGGNESENGYIEFGLINSLCSISFKYRLKTISSSAPDYFDAFCAIRESLAIENLIPFCYGSSLNVYPSGMCRDMGSGLMAYKLVLGRTTARTDIVRIFDSGHDVVPASVVNQKDFYQEWIASISG